MEKICFVQDGEHIYESMAPSMASEPFIIADTQHSAIRKKGFPLDSLSIHIRTNKYYYDLSKEEIKAEEVSQEESYDLLQAFQMLDGEERMILSCSILEGYSSEEIGHMLAMNPATVRSKKSRALEKLRKNLA